MRQINSAQSILALIKNLEHNYNPEKWVVDGLDIWPVLRVNIYYELSLVLLNNQQSKKQRFSINILKRAISLFVAKFKKIKSTKGVLLVSDGISYINLNQRKYERFCDPIIETLIQKNISWAKWDLLKGNYFTDASYVAQNLLSKVDGLLLVDRIFEKPNKIDLSKLPLSSFLLELKEQTVGTINWTITDVENRIQKILKLESYFNDLLSKNKPKVVLIVGYYADRAMALISACRKLRISTADLQHGVQGPMHCAYASWDLKEKQAFNTLPNDFLVWQKMDKQQIDKWSESTHHNAFVLGNVFEERWYAFDSKTINEFDEEIEKLISSLSAKNTILFTLQYGIEYNNSIFELIRATQQNINWLLRFHPLSSKEEKQVVFDKIKKHNLKNVEFHKASKLPLYGLLRNVNLHFTHSSSTVVEAKNFGLKSIVYNSYGAELFPDEIRDGDAIFESDLMQLEQIIAENLTEKYTKRFTSETSKAAIEVDRISTYLKQYL